MAANARVLGALGVAAIGGALVWTNRAPATKAEGFKGNHTQGHTGNPSTTSGPSSNASSLPATPVTEGTSSAADAKGSSNSASGHSRAKAKMEQGVAQTTEGKAAQQDRVGGAAHGRL